MKVHGLAFHHNQLDLDDLGEFGEILFIWGVLLAFSH